MILQHNGDLLQAKENIIIHQVNCQGVMNSGIAKQIRQKWPKVYTNYKNLFDNLEGEKIDLLGHSQLVVIDEEKGKYIYNLFGQFNYGYDGLRYTNYEAIFNGLSKIKQLAQKHNLSVALPYNMGCDRGGANWGIVSKMIEVIFEDYEVHIYRKD